MNLGPPVNTEVIDANAVLSKDGLSLYFDSDRTDINPVGARDIYVSRRDCTDCRWQTPVNLGPQINTPYVDGSPEVSDDGHLLFFISHAPREDCPANPSAPDPIRPCDEDIYVSSRADPRNDLGWGPPVRLGPDINTSGFDNSPEYVENGEEGPVNLYFTRNNDIYYAAIRVTRRGGPHGPVIETLGPAAPVVELNLPNTLDLFPTVRGDGRELFFFSNNRRPGGLGGLDLWTSTRRSVHEPWSEPRNLGAPLNSAVADHAPRLSHDGRTLVFTSARQGARNNWDIWMTTRTPGGRH